MILVELGRDISGVSNLQHQMDIAGTLDDAMEAANAEMRMRHEDKYEDMLPGNNFTLRLNPHLNDAEIADALKWQPIFDHENILLWGPLGNGKGVLGYSTVKKADWYYSKHIIMDSKPYELFDLFFVPRFHDLELHNPHEPIHVKHSEYTLFTKQEFLKQISMMGDVALGNLANEADPQMAVMEQKKASDVRRATGIWMTQQGQVMFQDGMLVLDEVKRYHNYMRQNEPFGVMLTSNDDLLRHIHLCRFGMTAYYNELDPNKYLPKVTVEIKCRKSDANTNVFMGDMSKVIWNENKKSREFRRLRIIEADVLEPWELLGGTVAEITQFGMDIIKDLEREKDPKAVNLFRVLNLLKAHDGRCAIWDIGINAGLDSDNPSVEVTKILMTYTKLIKIQYANTELVADVDKGTYNVHDEVRLTPVLFLKDTTGFRDEKGVAWLENEYIGYAIRTDKDGWAYEKGKRTTRYEKYTNCLIGIQRRLNWRRNHCEPSEHKIGAVVYTTYGIGDTYNSWGAFGQPIYKSMTK